MDQSPSIWRNLRHWSLHVSLNASASFVFAFLGGWGNAQGVAGMVAGIAAFIALYTWVWSSGWFHRRVPPGSAGRRALLYGTRARSTLGVLGLLSVFSDRYPGAFSRAFGLFFLPDIWAGIMAYSCMTNLGRSPFVRSLRIAIGGADPQVRAHDPLIGDTNSLLPTFLITLAEGFLLTVMLLAISWFCLQIIKFHANPGPDLRQPDDEF